MCHSRQKCYCKIGGINKLFQPIIAHYFAFPYICAMHVAYEIVPDEVFGNLMPIEKQHPLISESVLFRH